jgi:hypothetical protein
MPPPPPPLRIASVRGSGGPLASQAHMLYSGENAQTHEYPSIDAGFVNPVQQSWTGAEANSIEALSRSFTGGSESFAASQVSGRVDSVNQLSQVTGPLEAFSSMLQLAEVAPPAVSLKRSPLKKLAHLLRGGSKRKKDENSANSAHNGVGSYTGGVVKRNLIRSTDGSIQWQPNNSVGVGAKKVVDQAMMYSSEDDQDLTY